MALSATATSICGTRSRIERQSSSCASGSMQCPGGRGEHLAGLQLRDVRARCARGSRPPRSPSCARNLRAEARAAPVVPHRAAQGRKPAPRGEAAPAARGCPAARAPWRRAASLGSRCCRAQPPQTPKCAQRGVTRPAAGSSTSSSCASSCWRWRRVRRKRMRSPGSAPATKAVLPPRTTPSPSCVRRRHRRGLLRTRGTQARRLPGAQELARSAARGRPRR